MSKTIHVCLVSDQPMPNLLPILDKQRRPDKAILLVSDQMKEKAESLKQVFTQLQVNCDLITVDAYDANSIQETLLDLLGKYEECDISLNVTGGTKIMAIVAQEVFRSFGKPAFYINVQNDQVLELPDNTQKNVSNRFVQSSIAPVLKLDLLLAAHGWQVEGQQKPRPMEGPQLEYVRFVLQNILNKEYSGAVAMMNGVASNSENKNTLCLELNRRESDIRSFGELIDYAIDAGLLIESAGKANDFTFADQAARVFIKGGWLENYVFDQLRVHRTEIKLQDEALNLLVKKPGKGKDVKNEIDIAFIARNQLYVIECKTALLQKTNENGKGTKGTDALYKLDALAEKLGGLRTHKMVISFRKLNQADEKRARDYKIQVVGPDKLHRLGEVIRQWVTES